MSAVWVTNVMGLLNSPGLSSGFRAKGLSSMLFFLYFLILALSLADPVHFCVFSYNDSETNISIYIAHLWFWSSLVVIQSLLNISAWVSPGPWIQQVQTCINDLFPLRYDSSRVLVSVKSIAILPSPKPEAWALYLTPPFPTPSLPFYYYVKLVLPSKLQTYI